MPTPPEIKMQLHQLQERMAPILEKVEKRRHRQRCLRDIAFFIAGSFVTFVALAIVLIQSIP